MGAPDGTIALLNMPNMAFKKGAEPIPGAGNEGYTVASTGVGAGTGVGGFVGGLIGGSGDDAGGDGLDGDDTGEDGAGLRGDAIVVDLSDWESNCSTSSSI